MTTSNHAPRKSNPKQKTHFLSVRSHAPEPQLHEFPASPPRATPRPRPPGARFFFGEIEPVG